MSNDGRNSCKNPPYQLYAPPLDLPGYEVTYRANPKARSKSKKNRKKLQGKWLQHFSNEESYIHKLKTILGHHLN